MEFIIMMLASVLLFGGLMLILNWVRYKKRRTGCCSSSASLKQGSEKRVVHACGDRCSCS